MRSLTNNSKNELVWKQFESIENAVSQIPRYRKTAKEIKNDNLSLKNSYRITNGNILSNHSCTIQNIKSRRSSTSDVIALGRAIASSRKREGRSFRAPRRISCLPQAPSKSSSMAITEIKQVHLRKPYPSTKPSKNEISADVINALKKIKATPESLRQCLNNHEASRRKGRRFNSSPRNTSNRDSPRCEFPEMQSIMTPKPKQNISDDENEARFRQLEYAGRSLSRGPSDERGESQIGCQNDSTPLVSQPNRTNKAYPTDRFTEGPSQRVGLLSSSTVATDESFENREQVSHRFLETAEDKQISIRKTPSVVVPMSTADVNCSIEQDNDSLFTRKLSGEESPTNSVIQSLQVVHRYNISNEAMVTTSSNDIVSKVRHRCRQDDRELFEYNTKSPYTFLVSVPHTSRRSVSVENNACHQIETHKLSMASPVRLTIPRSKSYNRNMFYSVGLIVIVLLCVFSLMSTDIIDGLFEEEVLDQFIA